MTTTPLFQETARTRNKSLPQRAAAACLLAAACATGELSEPPASSSPVAGAFQLAGPVGDLVPDVTLQLDDGSRWMAREAVRPALLVFWAEW